MDINNLFKLAAEKKASDIHLLFGQNPVFRIDGQLININEAVAGGDFTPLTALDLEGIMVL